MRIEATRIGIIYKPKTLVVEYKKSEYSDKRFHKKITFQNYYYENTQTLSDSYPFLASIPSSLLDNMMNKLFSEVQDLNKVPNNDLRHAKEVMNRVFMQNRLTLGDPKYQYDKRINHEPESDSSWD
jgi:hypothetical protein